MASRFVNRLTAKSLIILLALNAIVLVAVTAVNFGTSLGPGRINAAAWLDLPATGGVIHRPWTLLTYMVTQTDVWQAIFNMLWLYWFGSIFQTLTSPGRLLSLYVIGGLSGGLCYIAGTLLWPSTAGAGLEGASAAVMAIVTATACLSPNFSLRFFIIGNVRLKWIALITIAIFAFGLTGNNAGAHIAHLGGVAAGAVYALAGRMRAARGRRRPAPAMTPRSMTEAEARARLDAILDKVRTSGYASLTAQERKLLFELSHKI